VLVELVLDEWNADTGMAYADGTPCFVVARAALDALMSRAEPLPASSREALEARLARGVARWESENEFDQDDWGLLERLQEWLREG